MSTQLLGFAAQTAKRAADAWSMGCELYEHGVRSEQEVFPEMDVIFASLEAPPRSLKAYKGRATDVSFGTKRAIVTNLRTVHSAWVPYASPSLRCCVCTGVAASDQPLGLQIPRRGNGRDQARVTRSLRALGAA